MMVQNCSRRIYGESIVDIEREKTEKMIDPTLDLILRLRIRASIRRKISTRKSVQEGKPDRLADLLEASANELSRLKNELEFERNRNIFSFLANYFSFRRK